MATIHKISGTAVHNGVIIMSAMPNGNHTRGLLGYEHKVVEMLNKFLLTFLQLSLILVLMILDITLEMLLHNGILVR